MNIPMEVFKPRVIDRATALRELAKDAQWIVRDNEIEWLNEATPQPPIEVIDAKVAELVAAEPLRLLRLQRNSLIAETDWTQAADSPLDAADKSAWQNYRQALRDITQTYTSLDDVVWPTKPGEEV